MLKPLLFFSFLILNVTAKNAQNNDFQAGLYNVVSGSIIGGAGALINKKPNEKMGNVLLKGLGQGAFGGYITFESKKLIRNFAKTGNYAYVWPSRLVNSLGNSVILNAASNRNFWERYYLDIGFGHFEYDVMKEKGISVRIMPFSLFGAVNMFSYGKLDLKRSVYTGLFFFKSNEFEENDGWAIYNNITIHENLLKNRSEVIAHEIIHAYQYEGLIGVNSFVDKPSSMWDQSKFWKTYDSIFYTDFNGPLHNLLYALDKGFNKPHGDRLHEREAIYFSSHN